MKQNKVLRVLVCVLSGIILLMIAGIVLILLSPDGEETSEYLAGSRGVIGFYGRGLTTDGDDLIVDTPELSLVLTPVDDDDVSGIEGETEDGTKYTITGSPTDKADAGTVIRIKTSAGTVEAKVKDNPSGASAAKAAETAAKLVMKEGYEKGADDWSTSASLWYFGKAECVFRYPSALGVFSEKDDGSLRITDKRSGAVLTVTLSKNNYSSIDEIEAFMKNSPSNTLLALGYDWYTAETKTKKHTEYTYCGLGNEYIVEATLKYENKYSFVFDDLRELIKCDFVGNGVWKSKDLDPDYVNEAAKKSREKRKKSGTLTAKKVSYYDEELGVTLYYPDIFTLARAKSGDTIFTDPASGAYIQLTALPGSYGSVDDILAEYPGGEIDRDGRVRDFDPNPGDSEYVATVAVLSGKTAVAARMYYDKELTESYSGLTDMLDIVPAGGTDTTEFVSHFIDREGCMISLPADFTAPSMGDGGDDGILYVSEGRSGISAEISFERISDDSLSVYDLVDTDGYESLSIKGRTLRCVFSDGSMLIASENGRRLGVMTLPSGSADSFGGVIDRFDIIFTTDSFTSEYNEDDGNMDETTGETIRDAETTEKETEPAETKKTETTKSPETSKSPESTKSPETTKAPETSSDRVFELDKTPLSEMEEISTPETDLSGDLNVIVFSPLSEEQEAEVFNVMRALVDAGFSLDDKHEYPEYGTLTYYFSGGYEDFTMYVEFYFYIDTIEGISCTLSYFFDQNMTGIRNGDIVWIGDHSEEELRSCISPMHAAEAVKSFRQFMKQKGYSPDDYVFGIEVRYFGYDEATDTLSAVGDAPRAVLSLGRVSGDTFTPTVSYVYDLVNDVFLPIP